MVRERKLEPRPALVLELVEGLHPDARPNDQRRKRKQMTDSAAKLASLMPGTEVSEDGDTIIVQVPSGIYAGRIPTVWEGRPVRVFTTPSATAGPVLKLSVCILMAALVDIILVGLASLAVVLLVRFQ